MKKLLRKSLLLSAAVLTAACSTGPQGPDRESLAAGFASPPDSIQTSVYWYWISNNVSKEGVVKDLQSMKKAGINRAFIGNIGLEDVPYGNVPMLSEAWWEILHTALKTASELDIEIGIFNSPGWSQSGGPWVKPEQAMRYLASSELRVTGPAKLNQMLKTPTAEFQDIRVIAYPAPKEDDKMLTAKTGKISAPALKNASVLLDRDTATYAELPSEREIFIDLEAPEDFTARSLTLYPTDRYLVADCRLEALDGGNWRTLTEFRIYRPNTVLNVGFDRDAPVVVSFPATESKNFRLAITSQLKGSRIAEMELRAAPRLERFAEKSMAKMFPEPLPFWPEYQWPQQAPVDDPARVVNPQGVLDISQYLAADGTLSWDVPEGQWVILRTGMTPTGMTNSPASPEATGYEADKMSKPHIRSHFDGHMGEVLRRIPAEDRRTFKVVVQDSYEMGSQNFTDGFLEEFATRYGYDPLPYLPAYYGYVVGSPEASDRFLWDMRRLVADKVAYDYVAGLREVSHEHGLTTWLENYGHWGFPGEFLMYGGQSDEIGGEFWAEGGLGDIENRAASSCGHIYNKKRIWAESFTSAGKTFERYPAQFKHRGDRFFAEGINASMLHVCISQPYDSLPGVNAWFGVEFNRGNTWFSQMDLFTTYLKRNNFMLQQGLNVADVAYFIGEDAPKMTGLAEPALPKGYQFDYMNAEVIERDMTVEKGRLILPHGTQYRILVLPPLESMRPELLSKISELVRQGATILGPAPQRSPSLQDQPRADSLVRALAAQLWGQADGKRVTSNKFGKGTVFCGISLEEAFAQMNLIPDCALPGEEPFLYGHRDLGKQQIYYVTNQSDQTRTLTPAFRVTGLQPELWLPATGAIRDLNAFTQGKETTEVPLSLAPYESVFVVFSRPATQPRGESLEVNFPAPATLSEVTNPWSVSFDAAMRGPVKPVTMSQLISWNTSSQDSVKYFSGTAVYTNTVTLPALPSGERILLDLGNVSAMAKVSINGTYAGGLWTPPYVLDITPWAQEGENRIEIEVVNTWVNRLIGDSKLPAAERKTWTVHNPYTPASTLQTSGLIGPVKVESVAW